MIDGIEAKKQNARRKTRLLSLENAKRYGLIRSLYDLSKEHVRTQFFVTVCFKHFRAWAISFCDFPAFGAVSFRVYWCHFSKKLLLAQHRRGRDLQVVEHVTSLHSV